MPEQFTEAELALEPSAPTRMAAVRRTLRRPSLVASWLVIVVVALWTVIPGAFTTGDPLHIGSGDSFAAPSLSHPVGTDQLGRDLLTRTIFGTSETVKATLLAVLLGLIVGSILGVLSGLARGLVDTVIGRLVAVLLAIPGLLLAMAVVAALGYGTTNIAIAVGVASIAPFARVMRSEVIRVASVDYVTAAYGSGAGFLRTAWNHVLPNAAPTVLALAALECGSALLAVASLGFLGFGTPPPQPEWGLAVAEGRNYLSLYPWISLLPGLIIVVVVVATNRISKSLGR
jgi:peptide/nickel transport system permease protein